MAFNSKCERLDVCDDNSRSIEEAAMLWQEYMLGHTPQSIENWLLHNIPEQYRAQWRISANGTAFVNLTSLSSTLMNLDANLKRGTAAINQINVANDNSDFLSSNLFFINLICVFRSLNVNRVRGTASVSGSGKFLAHAGFLPSKRDWDSLRHKMLTKLNKMRIYYKKEDFMMAIEILSCSDPSALWEMLRLFKGYTCPILLDWMVDITWTGHIVLSDDTAVARLNLLADGQIHG